MTHNLRMALLYGVLITRVNVLTSNEHCRNHRWFSLLDAASFVPTNYLDLDAVRPDFVVFSFHKIFGYPTGLGALLIRKSSESALRKSYYGGGTVLMALSDDRRHVRRPKCHEW